MRFLSQRENLIPDREKENRHGSPDTCTQTPSVIISKWPETHTYCPARILIHARSHFNTSQPINRTNYVLKYSGCVWTHYLPSLVCGGLFPAGDSSCVCLFIYSFLFSCRASPSPLADNSDADQTSSQKSAVSDVCRENVR